MAPELPPCRPHPASLLRFGDLRVRRSAGRHHWQPGAPSLSATTTDDDADAAVHTSFKEAARIGQGSGVASVPTTTCAPEVTTGIGQGSRVASVPTTPCVWELSRILFARGSPSATSFFPPTADAAQPSRSRGTKWLPRTLAMHKVWGPSPTVLPCAVVPFLPRRSTQTMRKLLGSPPRSWTVACQ